MKTCRLSSNLFKPFKEILISLKDWNINFCYVVLFFQLGRAWGEQRYAHHLWQQTDENKRMPAIDVAPGETEFYLFSFCLPLLLLFPVAILKSVKVPWRCEARIKSVYHVLHLFSLAKSHLISSDPKKPFSLTLVWAFSPPLLTWCDRRAPKVACCSDTHVTALTLAGRRLSLRPGRSSVSVLSLPLPISYRYFPSPKQLLF